MRGVLMKLAQEVLGSDKDVVVLQVHINNAQCLMQSVKVFS